MSNEALEAAVLRKLLSHLSARTDVQNIDMMGVTGFCRNCLADWYREAADEAGESLSKDDARRIVYGMDAADFKAKYQTPASQDQMDAMAESVQKNKDLRGW